MTQLPMHAATMYLEMWKRKQSVIAWEWDMADFESDEQTRPEFEKVYMLHSPRLGGKEKGGGLALFNVQTNVN